MYCGAHFAAVEGMQNPMNSVESTCCTLVSPSGMIGKASDLTDALRLARRQSDRFGPGTKITRDRDGHLLASIPGRFPSKTPKIGPVVGVVDSVWFGDDGGEVDADDLNERRGKSSHPARQTAAYPAANRRT